MIISHKFSYLFIEIPLTASWAIRKELCEYYQGIPILHKHATFSEFRKIASKDQLNYYTFATVRNPLDVIVSNYIKLIGDHKGVFTNPESAKRLVTDYSDLKKYSVVKENNLDFEGYFLNYFRRPYSDMIDLSGDALDFVIRFENLQHDFSLVLEHLGVTQRRPIPIINKTVGKDKPYINYYKPQIVERAKRICGPFMKKWGYEFPQGWDDYQTSWSDDIQYQIVLKLKYIYIVNFRYNNSLFARAIRRLRAVFK